MFQTMNHNYGMEFESQKHGSNPACFGFRFYLEFQRYCFWVRTLQRTHQNTSLHYSFKIFTFPKNLNETAPDEKPTKSLLVGMDLRIRHWEYTQIPPFWWRWLTHRIGKICLGKWKKNRICFVKWEFCVILHYVWSLIWRAIQCSPFSGKFEPQNHWSKVLGTPLYLLYYILLVFCLAIATHLKIKSMA